MRSAKVTTSITIILLTIIAASLLMAPRFDYASLVKRQAAIESSVAKLSESIHAAYEDLAMFQRNVQPSVADATERLGTLEGIHDRLAATEQQLDQLEKDLNLPHRSDLKPNSLSNNVSPTVHATLQALDELKHSELHDLPPHLQKISDTLDQNRTFVDWNFDTFLAQAIQAGLLPFSSTQQLPPELRTQLEQRFRLFQTNARLFDTYQRVLLGTLVTRANSEGRYVELPLDASIAAQEEAQRNLPPGVALVRTFEALGVQRIFNFPSEEHPEWAQIQNMRENAKRHLVQDLATAFNE